MKNKWNVRLNLECALVISGFNQRLNTAPPKVVQSSKCLKYGHISACCKTRHECCCIYSQEGHNHKNCTNRENEKCNKCNGSHAAVSRYCLVKQEKVEELCSRKQYPILSWLTKLKHEGSNRQRTKYSQHSTNP